MWDVVIDFWFLFRFCLECVYMEVWYYVWIWWIELVWMWFERCGYVGLSYDDVFCDVLGWSVFLFRYDDGVCFMWWCKCDFWWFVWFFVNCICVGVCVILICLLLNVWGIGWDLFVLFCFWIWCVLESIWFVRWLVVFVYWFDFGNGGCWCDYEIFLSWMLVVGWFVLC